VNGDDAVSVDAARIAAGRELVLRVLRGEITEETHRALFDEDVVWFQVRILERHDLPWLLAQLQNTAFDRTCRELVLANLSQEAGNKVLSTW
jgi:hypothetical protein